MSDNLNAQLGAAVSDLRSAKLAALAVGDIVGAAFPDGNILPFLVIGADAATVEVRAITGQFPLRFDRAEGEAEQMEDGEKRAWRIVCVQPLPLEHHQLLLSLDRRMRLGFNGTSYALDAGDIRALMYLSDHWSAHPI